MPDTTPVQLFEDGDTGDRFLIYGSTGDVKVGAEFEVKIRDHLNEFGQQ